MILASAFLLYGNFACKTMYFCQPNSPIKIFSMYKFFLLIAGLVLLLFSCNSETKCKYKPEPIFEAGLPHILQYNFETQGSQSMESILLDSNVLLEISQDICNDSRQEYRFTVQGDFSQYPDSLWMKEAVRQLVFLSTFSPKQAALKVWADVLEEQRQDMRLGEDAEIQAGVQVRVDRIVSPEQSTLLLVLAQGE